MKKIILLFCALVSMVAQAQTLLSEDFDYSDSLTKNGWTAVSAQGTNGLIPTATGLVKTGYANSGIGKAVDLASSGEDLKKDLTTAVKTGNAYVSFLMSVKTAAKTAGSYVTGFTSGSTGSNYNVRFYIKNDSTGGFNFGIGRGTSTAQFATTKYIFNTTYLVTLKYAYNASATLNDTAAFYVHPASSTTITEPIPTAYTLSNMGIGSGSDATELTAFYLRQGTASDSITLTIDGIRVATTWAGSVSKTSALRSIEKPVFKAYPTITTGKVNLEFDKIGVSADISVVTIQGQVILHKKGVYTVTPSHAERDGANGTHRDEAESIKGEYFLDLSHLANGSYIIQLVYDKNIATQLIEKQ